MTTASISECKMQTEHVSVFYADKCAIDDVSLDIKGRSVTALIGPSGCGKSTYLRSLNRMNDTIDIARVEGKITLDGHDIYAKGVDAVEVRRRVGMVFQKSNPFPKSIFENVAFGLRIAGEKNASVLTRRVEESLSGAGQQQRLCIARCLAVRPEVILMDEPTSALDPIATARAEELIRELKEDYTIIIVTHSMQQAARISDYTAFFYMGELVESGETDQIFTRPRESRTEEYITGRFG